MLELNISTIASWSIKYPRQPSQPVSHGYLPVKTLVVAATVVGGKTEVIVSNLFFKINLDSSACSLSMVSPKPSSNVKTIVFPLFLANTSSNFS